MSSDRKTFCVDHDVSKHTMRQNHFQRISVVFGQKKAFGLSSLQNQQQQQHQQQQQQQQHPPYLVFCPFVTLTWR